MTSTPETLPETEGTPRRTWLLAGVLWLVLIAAGVWSWQRTVSQRRVAQVCDAVAVEDWATALEGTTGWVAATAPGRRITECRALALLASEGREQAVTLLESQLAEPANRDWLPDPVLVLLVADAWQQSGRLPEAVDLVRRATLRFPDDPDLQFLELELRSRREPEARVLEELTTRLDTMGSAAPWMRIRLAQRHLARRELAAARTLLATRPPAGGADLRDEWFRVRSALAGAAADSQDLAQVIEAWRAAGGREDETLGWHALTRSLYQLSDPAHPTLAMLETAATRCPGAGESLCQNLLRRLLGTYQLAGRLDDALALYDRFAGRLDLGLSRAELQRSETLALDEATGDAATSTARVRFELLAEGSVGIPSVDDLETTLWVSPPASAPVDTPYEPHPLRQGQILEIDWTPGVAPMRWVLEVTNGLARTSREGRSALASGSLWPTAGESHAVSLDLAVPPAETNADAWRALRATAGDVATTTEALRRPGDGHRRVLVVLLDCADWRLVRWLRTRGELPFFGSLLERGLQAVVESRPAFTAAAIDALTHPAQPRVVTPLSSLHQLGVELASNTFVGGNPVGGLGWFLPERRGLFASLGANDRVVVNLLFSEGGIDGGRHGEMVGPGGQRRRFRDWRRRRPLEEIAARALTEVLDDPNRRAWIEEMAADFDTATAVAANPEIDLLMLRVDPLDPATHAGFAEVSAGGRDDRQRWLFDFYRYADHRLVEVERQLDTDDILVVLSDHGIRSSMEHSPWAFFVAVGGGLEPGRVTGAPALRTLPKLLADWLGEPQAWPAANWSAETSAGLAASLPTTLHPTAAQVDPGSR